MIGAADFSPDGKYLALGRDAELTVVTFPQLEVVTRHSFPSEVKALKFAPTGSLLAVGGREVALFDYDAGVLSNPSLPSSQEIIALTFHTSGDQLAVVAAGGTEVLEVSAEGQAPSLQRVSGRRRHPNAFTQYHSVPFLTPLWTTDRRMVTCYGGSNLAILDANTGDELRRIDTGLWSTDGWALSPDERHFVVHGWYGAQMYDLATGMAIGARLRHTNRVTSVAFLPDGKRVMTGGNDHTTRLWEVPTGKQIGSPHHHTGEFWSIHPLKQGWVSVEMGGLIRLHRSAIDAVPRARFQSPLHYKAGRSLLSGSENELLVQQGEALRVVSVQEGKYLGPPFPVSAEFRSVGLAGRTKTAIVTSLHSIEFRNWTTGQETAARIQPPTSAHSTAVSPNEQFAVITCDKQALWIEIATGKVLQQLPYAAQAELVNHRPQVRFSPKGDLFFLYKSWSPAYAFRVEGKHVRTDRALDQSKSVDNLTFSADGKLVATTGFDGMARIWRLEDSRLMQEILHPDVVHSASFSPNADRLVSTSRDGYSRVWDVGTGRLLCPPMEQGGDVFGAAFFDEGRLVFTASGNATARIWDPASGKPVTPLITLGSPSGCYLLKDGVTVLTDLGGQSTLFDLKGITLASKVELSPKTMLRLAEINATQYLHSGGGAVRLAPREWVERWQLLRREDPDLHEDTGPCLPPPDNLAARWSESDLALDELYSDCWRIVATNRRRLPEYRVALNRAEPLLARAAEEKDCRRLIILGAVLLRNGHLPQAIEMLRRARDTSEKRSNPDNLTAVALLALAHLYSGGRHEEPQLFMELQSLSGQFTTPDIILQELMREATWAVYASDFVWQTATPQKTAAAAGVEFHARPDHSISVRGANPDHCTYVLDFNLAPGEIRAIRLEALRDAALPSGGPGRRDNGTFIVSRVSLQQLDDAGEVQAELPLGRAKADFHQDGHAPETLLDNNPLSGWAIHQSRLRTLELFDQAVVLELAKPLIVDRPTTLRVLIEHQSAWAGCSLGRFRISFGAAAK